MAATHREDQLIVSDGITLHVRQDTVDNPIGVVVVVHGLCEHSGRYDYAAAQFTGWGYSVFRFDLRGHGRSGGERGYVSDYHRFLTDTADVVQYARMQYPEKPCFLLGHSMGGFIAAAYGVNYPNRLTGVIHSGAAVTVLPMIAALGDFDYNAAPLAPIPNDLAQLVSRDPEVVKAYREDPLVLKEFTTKLMGEVFIRGARWLVENMGRYEYPCLILHGGGDQIVPAEASRYFHGHIASIDKTLKIYEGLYHEILNEPEKETVLSDIHTWLAQHT